MQFPAYAYPFHLVPSLAGSLLFGGERSFRTDARACMHRLQPPLRLLGAENIPRHGPALVTFNHYHRPGFHAWWLALAVAASLPMEMHWVTTAELTFPGKWYAFIGRPLSRWLLHRLGGIYGFTSMPPMPPRPGDVEARARAVRGCLAYAKEHADAVIGLAPEGSDSADGSLRMPAPGAGRFLLLLAGQGFPIVPAAAWEQDGALCLRFGEAYDLVLDGGYDRHDRDHLAAAMVMQKIADLLPVSLSGGLRPDD